VSGQLHTHDSPFVSHHNHRKEDVGVDHIFVKPLSTSEYAIVALNQADTYAAQVPKEIISNVELKLI
jgi:hypothetical protein